METKSQELILEHMKSAWYCPGVEDCGITKCQHSAPHARTDGCECGCFESAGCLSLAEGKNGLLIAGIIYFFVK